MKSESKKRVEAFRAEAAQQVSARSKRDSAIDILSSLEADAHRLQKAARQLHDRIYKHAKSDDDLRKLSMINIKSYARNIESFVRDLGKFIR